MHFSANFHYAFLICLLFFSLALPSRGAESLQRLRAVDDAPDSPVTLSGAVSLARRNFPKLLQQEAEVRATKSNISLQKVKEYNPNALMSYQVVAATHNRLTQTLFSSAVLPTTPGPGYDTLHEAPRAFSASGFIIDWAPLDFGLHKARIGFAKSEYNLSSANLGLTQLDVSVEAASRFLDTLVMKEQVAVAEANVKRFQDFSTVVHAQVDSGLKAGADASLADSQLANSRNDLIRARLNLDLSKASLAYIVGLGGRLLDIEPGGIIYVTEPSDSQKNTPVYESHPLALSKKAEIDLRMASRKILEKQYYPTFRWLAGGNLRGTTFNTNRGDVSAPDVSGIIPVVPNWNVGLMVDFPFMDILRIQAEKKVVDQRIMAAQQGYSLAIQQLRTEDVQARSKVQAAVELAANMPVQVSAALLAAQQAQARYQAGLATVAQVAEANQILADSRVKEAVANVGVWKALLSAAAVHGDLKPFLASADLATQRGK